MSWHTGISISQSLLISCYVDSLLWPNPVNLQDAQFARNTAPDQGLLHSVLRPYVLATIKSADFVYRKLVSEKMYEVGSCPGVGTG